MNYVIYIRNNIIHFTNENNYKRTLHFPNNILSAGAQMYNNRKSVNMYDAIFITECLHLDLDDI